MKWQPLAFNLFWRTFLLLALLLASGIMAWVVTLRQLELQPRTVQTAQQIASLVKLARSALLMTDEINQAVAIKTMTDDKAIAFEPRSPDDRWQALEDDAFSRLLASELHDRLGAQTIVARSVNGRPALWIGLDIQGRQYWLNVNSAGLQPITTTTWTVWFVIGLLATVLGSAFIARQINKPLQQLSRAANRIRDGAYEANLDETTLTSEVREVNIRFNRMVHELAKISQERAVMLAGISHDLRTPLARLRLEAEISVPDEEARRNMAADIDQLDNIINKFMDYARPGSVDIRSVDAAAIARREAQAFRDHNQIRIDVRLPPDLYVMGDDTELGRIFANLFENARRYGRTIDTEIATVEVTLVPARDKVVIMVRDYGDGVAADKLGLLTTPFFRGDAARTAASGSGLGLSIVQKSIHRLGGELALSNAPSGGFAAELHLQKG